MALTGKTSYLHNDFVVLRSNGVPELGTILAFEGKVFKISKLTFCKDRIKAHLTTVENLDWLRDNINKDADSEFLSEL